MRVTPRPDHETCITHMLHEKLHLLNRFRCLHCDQSNLVCQDQATAGPEDEWRQDNSYSMHSSNLSTNGKKFFCISYPMHRIIFTHVIRQKVTYICAFTFISHLLVGR
jgi:hypothetical protein